jgi:hypothetical protein
MAKIKKVLNSMFQLLFSVLFLYLLITHFSYTVATIVIVLTLVGIVIFFSIKYMLYKIDKKDLFKLFEHANLKNNSNIARAAFRWNFVARYFFMKLLDNEVERKSKEETKTLVDMKCLEIFGISPLYTDAEVKASWKKLAKIYHPDKFQNEKDKKLASERFIRITECKDKLLRKGK